MRRFTEKSSDLNQILHILCVHMSNLLEYVVLCQFATIKKYL